LEESFDLVKCEEIVENDFRLFDWYAKSFHLMVEARQRETGLELDLQGEAWN